MDQKKDIYSKIDKSGNFPLLPEILLTLLDACEDEERPLPEIAHIISKDPILSFKALQLVNSAYYESQHKFRNIEQAVIYLGANCIKNIAVTTAVYQVFDYRHIKKVQRFSVKEFWWHSLLCATMAKRIARKIEYSNLDEAYLSGLLHDIGRIVLVSTFPQEHETLLAKTENHENVFWAEKQLIGTTHCEVGKWLVRKWQLTSLMADAINYHHQPLARISESFPLIKIVYFANLLSYHYDQKTAYETGKVLFKFEETDISELVDGASEEVEQVACSLGIHIKPPKAELSQENDENAGHTGFSETQSKEKDQEKHARAENELHLRVRNFSLLSGFLEELAKAGESEKMIGVFERCVNVLFDVKKVLFFLPDKQSVLLKAATSASNPYQQMSQDLIMPMKPQSSRVVKAFYDQEIDQVAASEKNSLSIVDRQILDVLDVPKMLIFPMKADGKPVGIILLGGPDPAMNFSESELKLLHIIAQQLGLSLYLERIKKEKEAELESERMAAISMTAKKFAHEVNNPLGIISNYLTYLKLKLDGEKNSSIQEDLEIIEEEINRISSMVNQLDLFSQPISSETEEIDLNREIEKIIQLLQTSLLSTSGTLITFRPQDTLPPVDTSRDGFKQIIINLLKNAAEAMPEGGRIVVSTRETTADPLSGQPTGVEVSISDNGPGLPDNVKSNLYKPFVTTKSGNHTGLGLSIVNKAVLSLGGKISCISNEMQGTTFTLFFPLKIQ